MVTGGTVCSGGAPATSGAGQVTRSLPTAVASISGGSTIRTHTSSSPTGTATAPIGSGDGSASGPSTSSTASPSSKTAGCHTVAASGGSSGGSSATCTPVMAAGDRSYRVAVTAMWTYFRPMRGRVRVVVT